MKYFKEEEGCGESSISLIDDCAYDKCVFIVEKIGDQIRFVSGSDHYHSHIMSKVAAIETLKEAIAWIESEE